MHGKVVLHKHSIPVHDGLFFTLVTVKIRNGYAFLSISKTRAV